ncbi:MAG: Rha family transcriptional regulator [Desulfuromonadaceae bacterium]|nr:Rha family transcriptional regulator [Desulfuromonadaceae bacterium]
MNQIVTIQHRQAVTTSLKIAEIFGKRHKNVLQSIERLSADLPERDRLNFQPVENQDSKGEYRAMYQLNRKAFTLIAMGFTGKKALSFKSAYIDAFESMETALFNQKNLSWQEQRAENRSARRIETDSIARFVEYAENQGSRSARMYYQNITKMTHKALFLVKQASQQPFRDMLDGMQLAFLTTAEYLIQQALEDGMTAALHYRDVYTLARERVEHYAAQLPRQRLLMAGG